MGFSSANKATHSSDEKPGEDTEYFYAAFSPKTPLGLTTKIVCHESARG
jgi:hypothetical protein